MEFKINEEILRNAKNPFGAKNEVEILLESMASLQLSIYAKHRGQYGIGDIETHVAAVLIYLRQFMMFNAISDADMQESIDGIMKRLEKDTMEKEAKRRKKYCEMERDYRCQFDE